MKLEELLEILTYTPEEIVKELGITTFPEVPQWSDLEKEYDPMLHSIITDTARYPEKQNGNGADDFKRTPLSLQELAVNRLAQAMFATSVQRIYSNAGENDKMQKAADIFEQQYRVKNSIDSTNIERAKALNKSCQCCTIWKSYETEEIIEGEIVKTGITHDVYAEPDGYKLYPISDDNGKIICMSIGYTNTSEQEVFDIYTEFEIIRLIKKDEWEVEQGFPIKTDFLAVVYAHTTEPAWGGTHGTMLVEQLEEMLSYQGMYIKENSVPTFTLDLGSDEGATKGSAETTSNDERRVIEVGQGGKMEDVTWQGAEAAVKAQYERIRNAFFEQIQIPDISFATLITSNTSAENKELVFADAKAKAKDVGGQWEKLFYQEIEIVKKFCKVIFSSYQTEFDTLEIRSVIQPYNVRSKKETAEYIATGGTAMSLETKVRLLAEADDVSEEVERIQSEQSASANQGLF